MEQGDCQPPGVASVTARLLQDRPPKHIQICCPGEVAATVRASHPPHTHPILPSSQLADIRKGQEQSALNPKCLPYSGFLSPASKLEKFMAFQPPSNCYDWVPSLTLLVTNVENNPAFPASPTRHRSAGAKPQTGATVMVTTAMN